MKTYVLSFAIATLAAGALAGAQTPPSSTTPNSSQSSTTTTQTPSDNSSYSSSSADSKAQMKECVAKQKQMNPSLSDADAKKACKAE